MLNPIFGNAPFRMLILGPEADTMELGFAFLKALGSVGEAKDFAEWLDRGRTNMKSRMETLVIQLKPFWTSLDSGPVSLEISQTVVEDYIVCTSTPRSPLPEYTSASRATSPSRRTGRDFGMRIPNFPLSPSQMNPTVSAMTPAAFSALMRTPSSSSGQSSRSPERTSDNLVQNPGEVMKDMIENFDWKSTPLGPREQWSSALKVAVRYILAAPYPVCDET